MMTTQSENPEEIIGWLNGKPLNANMDEIGEVALYDSLIVSAAEYTSMRIALDRAASMTAGLVDLLKEYRKLPYGIGPIEFILKAARLMRLFGVNLPEELFQEEEVEE